MKALLRVLSACLIISFLSMNAFAANTQPGSAEYEAGVRAFKTGDYSTALEHFKDAQDMGRSGAALTYNLAVTHYKLGQLNESKRLFGKLEGNPRYRDLARYNLGLIAMRQGNIPEARNRFLMVRRTSDDEKLNYLAGEALKELDSTGKAGSFQDRGKDWLTLLSLGGGYNDNPLAFPESQLAPQAGDDDTFIEFLGYGQIYLNGGAGDGLRLNGFVFTKQYTDLDIVDVLTANGGVAYEGSYGDWDYAFGGGFGHSEIDGSTLTDRFQGSFKVERSLGDNEYTVKYRPVYHNAGSNFAYLEGWQHKLDLGWQRRSGNTRWSARYRLEYNNREDVLTSTNSLSFSPLRNSILLEADWFAMPDLTLTIGGEYTNSQYGDDNRLTDIDGVFKVKERKADKIEAWIQAEYQLSRHWIVRAEYDYTNNDENFELYKYESNEIKFAVEFTY